MKDKTNEANNTNDRSDYIVIGKIQKTTMTRFTVEGIPFEEMIW